MTPIERMKIRSDALATLGLKGSPTRSELRKVFRKLAFEKHPDHGNGSAEEFASITDAYSHLLETAIDDIEPTPADVPAYSFKRPTMMGTKTAVCGRAVSACRDVLDAHEGSGTLHVSTHLNRRGRILTYYVPSEPGLGLNKVAVATVDESDTDDIQAEVVDIWSSDVVGGVYTVPAQTCARKFPGVRSVQIRFGDTVRH